MAARRLLRLPARLAGQARLLLRDPQRFIQNLDHTLHPDKLLRKLLALEPMSPMHLQIDPDGARAPHLNVLLPALDPGRLTGGPNTVLTLARGLADAGMPVRLLAVDEPAPADAGALRAHIASLTGGAAADIVIGSTFEAGAPARIGARDVFLATYWTTAFRLKPVLPRMAVREFIYLIQDFEPGFYAWSSAHAQALETYGMAFRAVINEQLLADHLVQTRSGRFAEPGFLARCAVFEPAVDRRLFHAQPRPAGTPRTLLFYARPQQPRNLFGLGYEALRAALRDPVFAQAEWRFLAIGGGAALPALPLGEGRMLQPVAWRDYAAYAELMRQSDILLCPMLSPHTSYPVLEMAACRGVAVTNSFGAKTAERLRALSPGIIATEPGIEALRDGIIAAAEAGPRPAEGMALPGDWGTALAGTVAQTRRMFDEAVQAAASG